VPAVELAWWDVGSDQSRRATLPALSFSVAPGVAGDAMTPGPVRRPAPILAATADHPPRSDASAAWNPRLLDHRVWLVVGALLAALLAAIWLAVGRPRGRRIERRGCAGAPESGQPASAAAGLFCQRPSRGGECSA